LTEISSNVHPDNKYCPRCAGPLEYKFAEGRERLVCERCGSIFYLNPTPAIAVIMQRDHEVLLVRRKYNPQIGTWSLPAGFLELGEEPEQCAVREAKEETNLDIVVGDLFGVYPAMDDPRSQVVLIVYRCTMVDGELRAGDDADDAQFYSLEKLPQNISFTSHRKVLSALRKEMTK